MVRMGSRLTVTMLLLAVAFAQVTPAEAAVAFEETPIAGWSTNGTVYAVAVHGDTVYLGGSFTSVRGPGGSPTQARVNVAAISLSTGQILPFRADTNNQVRAIESDGSTVWIGGLFSTIRGVTQRRVAAVDSVTGALLTAFHPEPSAVVYSLAYSAADDALYIGGSFTSVDGVVANRVARLNPDTGTPVAGFQANASAPVRGLAVDANGGEVWAAGSFTSIGGTGRDYLAALDSNTGLAVGPALALVNAQLLAVDVTPDGSSVFGAVAGLQNRAQAWNTSTGARRWFQQAMGDAQALTYHDGTVYFGFHEGFAGDRTVRLLAADAITGALDPGFRPNIDSFHGIWALDASAGGLAGGGTFTTINGVATRGIAVFPSSGPTDTTPPTAPGTPTVSSTTAGAITLTWDAATDDVGVTGYEITRNDTEVGTPTSTTFTDTGLSPESTYSYRVRAVDAAGNVGPWSGSVDGTTGADTTAPSAPTGLTQAPSTADSIGLAWSASTDDVGVVEYRVSRDDVEIDTTGVTNYIDAGLVPGATHVYTVVAVDAAGNVSSPSAPLTASTATTNFEMITPGAVWRYLDDGSNQGTAWREPAFDASAWASGPAELGYGDGDEDTVVASGPTGNHYITTYFRHQFDVGAPGGITSLELRVQRDDGVVIYLNGVEVARSNLPNGTIGHLTRAPSGVNGAAEQAWLTFSIPANLLVSGTNVVAAEVHQNAPNSSDMTFDLELTGNPD